MTLDHGLLPATTPTGIPITDCETCGREHLITRRHCEVCGAPSIFVSPGGHCLTHNQPTAERISLDKILEVRK